MTKEAGRSNPNNIVRRNKMPQSRRQLQQLHKQQKHEEHTTHDNLSKSKFIHRLISFVQSCPDHQPQQSLCHDSTSRTTAATASAGRGITLPVNALSWLSSQIQLLTSTTATNDDEQQQKQYKNNNTKLIQDFLKFQNDIFKIHSLLNRITHLCINDDPWPPPSPLPTTTTTTLTPKKSSPQQRQQQQRRQQHQLISSSTTSRNRGRENELTQQQYHQQQRPCVNISMFPNLVVLLLDKVPPGYIINLDQLLLCRQGQLQSLHVECACIYSLPKFLFGQQLQHQQQLLRLLHQDVEEGEENKDEEQQQVQCHYTSKLKHLRLSKCGLGELSGLAGNSTNTSTCSSINSNSSKSSMQHQEQQRGEARATLNSAPPISLFDQLVSLDLSKNEIIHVKTAFAGLSSLPQLRKVDLSYNYISRYVVFDCYCCGGCCD